MGLPCSVNAFDMGAVEMGDLGSFNDGKARLASVLQMPLFQLLLHAYVEFSRSRYGCPALSRRLQAHGCVKVLYLQLDLRIVIV